MESLIRRLDLKHRRLFKIANVALILGLLPWIFREYIPMNHNWLDAWCGFFMGLCVTINFARLRASRRCQQTQA